MPPAWMDQTDPDKPSSCARVILSSIVLCRLQVAKDRNKALCQTHQDLELCWSQVCTKAVCLQLVCMGCWLSPLALWAWPCSWLALPRLTVCKAEPGNLCLPIVRLLQWEGGREGGRGRQNTNKDLSLPQASA